MLIFPASHVFSCQIHCNDKTLGLATFRTDLEMIRPGRQVGRDWKKHTALNRERILFKDSPQLFDKPLIVSINYNYLITSGFFSESQCRHRLVFAYILYIVRFCIEIE